MCLLRNLELVFAFFSLKCDFVIFRDYWTSGTLSKYAKVLLWKIIIWQCCTFAFFSCNSESDESCKKHLGRVLSIWEERSVYENDVLEQLRQALCKYFVCVWRFSLLFEILFLWLLCFRLDGDRKVRKRTYEQIKVDENNCSPRSSPTEPPQVSTFIKFCIAYGLLQSFSVTVVFERSLFFSLMRGCFWARVTTPETFLHSTLGYK